MTKPKTTVRSIRLPDETWEWLAFEAERTNVKVNALVALAVSKIRPPTSPAKKNPKAPAARIIQGLEEAGKIQRGEVAPARVYVPEDRLPPRPESEAARAFRIRKEAQDVAARLASAGPRSKK